MKNKYDVVIAGSGVAGLYAAIQFDDDIDVLVLTKEAKSISNSSLAQGGVACVLDFDDDSFDLHIYDTLVAGGYKNNLKSVQTLINEGPNDVRNIMKLGFDFDKNPDGSPKKTLEGGHSRRRIVHHKDTTGDNIITTLLAYAESKKNIEIAEFSMVDDIHKEENGFRLDLLLNQSQNKSVFTNFCILATGGIGRVYRYTTNPEVATGDGIRLAYELGAEIKNISFVQIHPTAFKAPNCDKQFLVSESVRGEGAYLLNCNKERFMHNYDSRLELAPRDVVSHAIMDESRKTNSDKFYLDIRYKGADYINKRFPGIKEGCLENGIDMTKDLIPIYPCQHYHMGGINTDLNAESSVKGIFAAGECAHTGVHGSNRLASNSLLEALVFGRRAAQEIMRRLDNDHEDVKVYDYDIKDGDKDFDNKIVDEIRDIMQECYFVSPNNDKLKSGLERLEKIKEKVIDGNYKITMKSCEAKSLATVAYLILKDVYEYEVSMGRCK